MKNYQEIIVNETCSKSLTEKVREENWIFEEMDLLLLILEHAPDFQKKLELLLLIEKEAINEEVKKWGNYFLKKEEWIYKNFTEKKKNFLYEVSLNGSKEHSGDKYLCETFEKAIFLANYYLKNFEENVTINNRFSICKRKIIETANLSDFVSDFLGEAQFKGFGELINLYLSDDYPFLSEEEEYLVAQAPKLPLFLVNFDLVSYIDDFGNEVMAVSLIPKNLQPEEKIFCHCVRLDEEMEKKKYINNRDDFFTDFIYPFSEHIRYPKLEKRIFSELKGFKKNAYEIFKKLYDKYFE